ncbi:hypothetical protein PI93_005820 [Pandoraea fibrosis]|uniref:Uncharacterized protein n=1 Tax=Pandoraea fibrosis TaxID=1891094 RepID=A0ABX6HMW3_9BURK|nr:hypothetical protein [Pandoraea fibrosis]QHE94220.1 hypothetical protein PJ20_022175 [Pandoraea fibrosis]QHF12216.1 hypothetical protein PI93_005820 [Pandoraea fibrosis]
MSLTPLSSTDLAFARHASSFAGRSPSRAIEARLPRSVWWVAAAVLALHWCVWIAAAWQTVDLGGNSSGRTAMQVALIKPPAPPAPPASQSPALHSPSVAKAPRRGGTPAELRAPALAIPQRQTPSPPMPATPAQPAQGQERPAPTLSAPILDWRADIARDAAARPSSNASSPVASTERAITDQSQRAAPRDTPSAQGNVAQRAFEREFGAGQAAVSGPKASREGGNPLGTRECIEMNGKKLCSRQRNRAGDIDPFMKRERLFAPDIGAR